MSREYLGVLILSTSPGVFYIYTIPTLQKEPLVNNTLQYFLLSSLHPPNSSVASQNFFSLIPPLSVHHLTLFLLSSAILRGHDIAVYFLTIIV